MDASVPRMYAPATINAITAEAADTIRITFNPRVLVSQVPQLMRAGAAGAATVSGISQISATVVELVFTGDVQGTSLLVEEGDFGIRTPAGGFVPAGTYAIPTFP
ncbi:MAG: hypothetical protein IT430_04635 [Phycisphaerales bacterium]|nr:hypothetical protein [Phycisphaerales bacterium]